MEIEFDPVKDAINIDKHGISLQRAADLRPTVFVDDQTRFPEARYRVYGTIDGLLYCLAAVRRGDKTHAISLRSAHGKEVRRYARPARSY